MTDSSIQITGTAAPHIIVEYTLPGPIQRFSIFYSRILPSPPSGQGDAGDFFVSNNNVFWKTQSGRWILCHFNQEVSHPVINGLRLSYTHEGPCWADATPGARRFGPEWDRARVATHFHEAIQYYHMRQGPGSDPNDPIDLSSD